MALPIIIAVLYVCSEPNALKLFSKGLGSFSQQCSTAERGGVARVSALRRDFEKL